MIKYIKSHLSVQVFLLTLVIQVSIGMITYLFIIFVTPHTYLDKINKNIDSVFKETIDQFSDMTIEECKEKLVELTKSYDVMVKLTDDEGREIEYGSDMQYAADYQDAGWEMRTNVEKKYVFKPEGGKGLYYTYVLSNGERVNLYKDSLKEIVPYLFCLIIFISLVLSSLYAKHVVAPVIRISKLAKTLADLKFVDCVDTGREDELGRIEESLYELSGHLDVALSELECANKSLREEIEKERNMEKQQLSFFSSASHELKTPITALKGHLQGMLYNVGGYKDHSKYLKRCLDIVENMQKLETEIMSSTKIRSSGFTMNILQFDLRMLVMEIINEYEDVAMHRGITIQDELGNTAVNIKADYDLLKRAISNIISNAIRYSPENENIKVEIEGNENAESLRVINQGSQIPENQIQKMFLPFTRLEESRNKETGGSGVGLYLVKMILDLHKFSYCLRNTETGSIEFEILFCNN